MPLAHRGLHGGEIPENSRAAFMAAIDAGYGIELDLQLASDGEAMVFHDFDLERLTGVAGLIQMQSSDALKNCHLKNGESIPTLIDILTLVAGRVPLLVEVKDQDGALGPNVGILEKRAAELVNAYDGPLAVMSFNSHAVCALQEHAPSVPRGLITSDFAPKSWPTVPRSRLDELAAIQDYDVCGADFISHRFNTLNIPRVAALKALGAAVICWTIKNPQDEARSRQFADNITFEGYLP